MPDTITIGGRKFKHFSETTLLHDTRTQAQILRAGLGRLELLPAETPDEYALRVYRTACVHGDVLLLLAHLMMPAEMSYRDWSPAVADEVAVFLGAITEPDEKRKVQAQLTGFLSSFLQAGLSYAVRSLNASNQETSEDWPDEPIAA